MRDTVNAIRTHYLHLPVQKPQWLVAPRQNKPKRINDNAIRIIFIQRCFDPNLLEREAKIKEAIGKNPNEREVVKPGEDERCGSPPQTIIRIIEATKKIKLMMVKCCDFITQYYQQFLRYQNQFCGSGQMRSELLIGRLLGLIYVGMD